MDAILNIEEESESSRKLEWDEEENNRLKRCKNLSEKIEKSKHVIRMGISNIYRPEIYLMLICSNKNVENIRKFWPDNDNICSEHKYDDIINLFGYPSYDLFVQKPYLEHFLTIVKNRNPDIQFCPMIPCVASLLLLYHDQFLAYVIIQSMININLDNDKYFVKNKKKFISMLSTIDSLICSNCKELYEHAKSIKVDFSVVSLFLIPIMFSKKLNKNIVLTIFDSYISEGRSVLIRYIIAIIMHLRSDLLQTNSPSTFMRTIIQYLKSLHLPSHIHNLRLTAFGRSYMKRKKVFPLEQAERLKNHFLNGYIDDQLPNIDSYFRFYSVPNNTYFGRRSNRITIDQMLYSKINGGKLITSAQFWQLKKKLSYSYCHLNGYPIFRLSEDGSSFLHFLSKASGYSCFMLIIKAATGSIGAFLANSLDLKNCKRSIGSSLTTVFELTNMNTYSYSRKNEFFLNVTRDSISIGNGSTGCAIYVENGFDFVVSDPCETFNSPPLLRNQSEKIIDVELYRLAV